MIVIIRKIMQIQVHKILSMTNKCGQYMQTYDDSLKCKKSETKPNAEHYGNH